MMNRLGALLLTLLGLVRPAPAQQDSFTGVKRIVAVGDVHGGYDEFVTILRAAGSDAAIR